MGGVRIKTVKKAARLIVEKHYTKLTNDFPTNKRIVAEVSVIASTPLKNKIAGYVTHLMRRIEKGPVRGISLKLQEEERESRENYVPDRSIMGDKTADIKIDQTTQEMLESIDFGQMSGVNLIEQNFKSYTHAHGYNRYFHRPQKHRDDAHLNALRRPARNVAPPVPTMEVLA